MKICSMCKEEYQPTGHCQKFCNSCGEMNKKIQAIKYHKEHYQRRGYEQLGESNNNWKGGIGTYRTKAKIKCERCNTAEGLLWHHKDQDRYNNKSDNLDNFDWIKYIQKYDDLKHINNENDAKNHWINHGKKRKQTLQSGLPVKSVYHLLQHYRRDSINDFRLRR